MTISISCNYFDSRWHSCLVLSPSQHSEGAAVKSREEIGEENLLVQLVPEAGSRAAQYCRTHFNAHF